MWAKINMPIKQRFQSRKEYGMSEIVYTKSEIVVFDIGLEVGNRIRSRQAKFELNNFYGDDKTIKWYHSGIHTTEEDWNKSTYNKSTEDVCKIYGIPYRQENKPLIGIEPRKIWLEKRLEGIKDTIMRYLDANKSINLSWVKEYEYLILEIDKETMK